MVICVLLICLLRLNVVKLVLKEKLICVVDFFILFVSNKLMFEGKKGGEGVVSVDVIVVKYLLIFLVLSNDILIGEF